MTAKLSGAACLAILLATVLPAQAQDTSMTFFVTSVGPGDGANLGGLDGADAHCQSARQGGRRDARRTGAPISARPRRAATLASTPATASARVHGRMPRGRSSPRASTICTQPRTRSPSSPPSPRRARSSAAAATASTRMTCSRARSGRHCIDAGGDMTCGNWTNNGEGSAIRRPSRPHRPRDDAPSKSWNSSHPSRNCSKDDLPKSGGNGLFYCFAAN